jgi:hypothetical protein
MSCFRHYEVLPLSGLRQVRLVGGRTSDEEVRRDCQEGISSVVLVAFPINSATISPFQKGNPFEQFYLIIDLQNLNSSHYTFKPFTNTYLTVRACNARTHAHSASLFSKSLCVKSSIRW